MKKLLSVFIFIILCSSSYGQRGSETGSSYEKLPFDIPFDMASYRAAISRQMGEYTRISYEEIYKLRRDVKRTWGDGFITSESLWVYYPPDMRFRIMTDFESGNIAIETLDTSVAGKEFFIDRLEFLITADTSVIFRTDPLVRNIEARMKSDGMYAVYADVEPDQILTSVVTGTANPTPEAVRYYAEKLYNAGTTKEFFLPNGVMAVRFTTSVNMRGPSPSAENAPGEYFLNSLTGGNRVSVKAADYKGSIGKYASIYGIPAALVYGVIHNESSFNPFATSYVPAYGLMQLVPSSGGMAAAEAVFGVPVILSPSYLYDYDDNIKLGSAYLGRIYHLYFGSIKDPDSRLYCTIAAYNTGIGNVALALTGSYDLGRAVNAVNSMTASECYDALMNKLPYAQTRAYLEKVMQSYDAYNGD